MPSWLLAAYQGSQWLTTDSPLAWDLQAIVTANALEADDTSQLLALAAGLKAVLVEPQTGMAAWLQDASTAAARFGLLDLLNAVRQYADHCPIADGPEYLVGIADEEAHKEIRAASSEASSSINGPCSCRRATSALRLSGGGFHVRQRRPRPADGPGVEGRPLRCRRRASGGRTVDRRRICRPSRGGTR